MHCFDSHPKSPVSCNWSRNRVGGLRFVRNTCPGDASNNSLDMIFVTLRTNRRHDFDSSGRKLDGSFKVEEN